MKQRMLGKVLGAALLLGAGTAVAAVPSGVAGPRSDADIARSLAHEIRMYPSYTIWDAVNFRVSNGQVDLSGAVSQPYKKADLARLARRVPGVAGVTDNLKVLPLSSHDDWLRVRIARAIYGDPVLNRYAMQAVPPIHILVDNGRVTLVGVVNNEMEKNVAGIRASGAGMSFGPVVNELTVEHPSAKRG